MSLVLFAVIGVVVCQAGISLLHHVWLSHIEARLNDLFPTPPGYPFRRGKVTTAADIQRIRRTTNE